MKTTQEWFGRSRRDLNEVARKLNATPADIPGLWNAPGYPELTTNQLLSIADARP